jgi:hypothetical protein
MNSKARIVNITLVSMLGLSVLAACSSGNTVSTDSSATAVASPTESTPVTPGTDTPTPAWTLVEPDLDADMAELRKDPNWVADSQLLAWPDPFPSWDATGTKFSEDQLESAIKEVVTFTNFIGWNDSLMNPDTTPTLAKAAFAPYATSNALKRFDELAENYLDFNKKIESGFNALKHFSVEQPVSEIDEWADWNEMASLMSFSVPYYVPFNELRPFPDGGGSTADPQVTWSVQEIRAPIDSDFLYITMTADRYVEVQGNPILKDGDIRVHRKVQFELIPNPQKIPGMPFLINNWIDLSLVDEEISQYFFKGDTTRKGPLEDATGL